VRAQCSLWIVSARRGCRLVRAGSRASHLASRSPKEQYDPRACERAAPRAPFLSAHERGSYVSEA